MPPAPKKRPAATAAFGASQNKLKQNTLFSFFKKAKPAAPAAKADYSVAKPAAPAAKPAAPAVEHAVGTRIEVYWPDDDAYYAGTVAKRRRVDSSSHFLEYDDGTCEWVDLGAEQYRLLKQNTNPAPAPAAAVSSNKRRRIQQEEDDDDEGDDEGEAEFDMDDASAASEESAYKAPDDDEDEEEEDDDQWMVTDDEGDDLPVDNTKKLKKKRAVKVIEHKTTSSKSPPRATTTTTTDSATLPASARRTPQHVTPAVSSGNGSTSHKNNNSSGSNLATFSWSQTQALALTPRQSQQSPQQPTQQSVLSTAPNSQGTPTGTPTATSVAKATTPPPYTKGVVNPAGSHVHNHLNYLRNPRDSHGRTRDDPAYDTRTLKVVLPDWERHVGKMTDAVKQWWELKAQYFDTVLLFKTGKFYELFHMDADAGVQACGLLYMKGHVAHAGFPEISYGPMADKLVRAGYKVARVEQTETPDMLKERKKKYKGRGGAPKVVNREVCSVMTLGTRTFCYLDGEEDGGLLGNAGSASTSIGPLLAIREVLLDQQPTSEGDTADNGCDNDNNIGAEDSIQPVCEYGITLVDAVRGTVTLGQFADDVLRSRMDTLLATFAPSEVRRRDHGETISTYVECPL